MLSTADQRPDGEAVSPSIVPPWSERSMHSALIQIGALTPDMRPSDASNLSADVTEGRTQPGTAILLRRGSPSAGFERVKDSAQPPGETLPEGTARGGMTPVSSPVGIPDATGHPSSDVSPRPVTLSGRELARVRRLLPRLPGADDGATGDATDGAMRSSRGLRTSTLAPSFASCCGSFALAPHQDQHERSRTTTIGSDPVPSTRLAVAPTSR